MSTRSLRATGALHAVPGILIALAGAGQALGAGPFGASINLSSLNGTDGFVCHGIDTFDRTGRSVSSAGDVNGDGIDDILIGAYGADPGGQIEAGESYIVFGGPGVGAGGSINLSALNGTNGFVINGIDPADFSGASVSSAGDVNGDGVDDILIGAYYAAPGGQNGAGESYIVFGGPGIGAGGSIELSSLNGTTGFVLNGIDAYDRSGSSVSSAGDVNGDGVDDILIGAKFADPAGQNGAGESYLVFGGPGVGAGGSINLSALNGTNGFVLNGIDPADFSGASVSSAGDVNGDGVDDILIGAGYADPGGQNDAGESYIVFGGPGVGAGGSINLSALNGTNGFALTGIDAYDVTGASVSSAGDVNGDGVDDILIGAKFASPGGQNSAGESYIVFGGSGVGAGGSIDLSSLNGATGFVLNGIDTLDFTGWSVSSAGDVNGDGADDILMGAYGAAPGGQNGAGEAYIVFGGPGVGAGGSINMSALDGTNGFVLNGIDAFDHTGTSVSSAGDVNGDGVDDILIGAGAADPGGQSYAGESYIVFGRLGQVWTSATGGSWDTGSKWLSGIAPIAGIVVIDTPVGITVTGPADAVFLRHLTLDADAGRTRLNLQTNSVISIDDPFTIGTRGAIGGSGLVQSLSGINNNGVIEPADLTLYTDDTTINTGDIRLETFAPTPEPKRLTVFGTLINLTGGEIVVRGAAVIEGLDGITNDEGTISFAFADASVYGELLNQGLVSISGGSQVILADDATNDALIELTTDSSLSILGTLTGDGVDGPGGGSSGPVYVEGGIIPGLLLQAGIASFGGNVSLGSAAVTIIEIGGEVAGVSMDQIDAAGTLGVAGALHVNIINGYVPQAGDAYKVLDFALRIGTFSSIVLDAALVNAGADTSTLLTDGTIRIPAPSCAGDVNSDGDTNISDFNILAGNFGSVVTPNTGGDLTGDGLVNISDFNILAGDFGCGG